MSIPRLCGVDSEHGSELLVHTDSIPRLCGVDS